MSCLTSAYSKSVTEHKRNRNTETDKGHTIKHSQQLRPQDHLHLVTGVVAMETKSENVVCAGLPWAQHAGGASDRRQVEVLRLAGAHPDLVPQGVVYHRVALLTDRDRTNIMNASNMKVSQRPVNHQIIIYRFQSRFIYMMERTKKPALIFTVVSVGKINIITMDQPTDHTSKETVQLLSIICRYTQTQL